MGEGLLIALVVFIWWVWNRKRSAAHPNYLVELSMELERAAEDLERREMHKQAIEPREIANALWGAQALYRRKKLAPSDDIDRYRFALLEASSDTFLNRWGISDLTGRRSRMRAALFAVVTKIEKLAPRS